MKTAGLGAIDPEGILRSALEKIVFFECRVSQLESELAAARTTAERARGDAAASRRHEVELEQAAAAERGARADAEARLLDLAERVRLLEGERERLLSGLVERARVGGAPGADGSPGPEEGGADLAGFIAELRAEIEQLRAWKAAAEARGVRVLPGAAEGSLAAGAPGGRGVEDVTGIAGRFEAEGRVGLGSKDALRLKDHLATRADRVLYERSMDELRAADPRARLRAVRALEALGSKASAPLLAAALGREAEAEVKAAILGALARFKEPFALDLATRELGDARPAVRVAALDVIAAVGGGPGGPGGLGGTGGDDRLAAGLGDPSPLVRRRAALHLGFTQGDRAEAALAVALGDPDRGVARAAAAALSGRPTVRAQGALARALEHPEAGVRRAAAAALGRVAGEHVDAEGSASDRRATARRIAERLAAMDGGALREAVIAGADASLDSASRPGPRRYARDGRPSPAVPAPAAAPVPAAHPERSAVAHAEARSRGAARVALATMKSRTAVAVATAEAPASDGLEARVEGEIRAALRGHTTPDLVRLTGAPAARVEAVLHALAARGSLVQRGARWFMA